MRTRFAVIGAGLVAMLSLTAGAVVAAVPVGTQDQHQENISWHALGFGGVGVAQTFTAGAPGTLTTVSVYIQMYDPDATDYHVTGTVYATSGGFPTGSALVTMTITPLAQTPTWYLFTFATPPTSVAGTQYAIVLQPASSMTWYGNCTDGYAGGQALINDGVWMDFATYGSNHGLGEASCVQDFAFASYVSAPGTTPPPSGTAIDTPSRDGGFPIGLLAIAGLASVMSLLVLRRTLVQRRAPARR